MYFPNKSILEATPTPGMSYTWRSILRGLDLLKEGVVWRVGSGEQIEVWKDPWIPSVSTRKQRTPDEMEEDLRVADLINPTTNQWDIEVLQGLFCEEDITTILSIPIRGGMEDCVAWHPDKRGVFSVKSAYHLGMYLRANKSGQVAATSAVLEGASPL
jgi:hypothetical protein